jgi:hypothetical protein
VGNGRLPAMVESHPPQGHRSRAGGILSWHFRAGKYEVW